MSERILVIGSNCFSGSNFVSHLLENDYGVAGISRSEEPDAVFLPYKSLGNGDFTFYQADLNNDLDKIMGIVGDFEPSYVVNFASQSMVAQSWDFPEHWFRTNVVSTVMLHDRLRKCKFLKKYVHISTPEVYGNCSGIVKENRCYEPSTPYAVSRAAADMSLMSFYRAYDFPVVFTRAANVYGSGQQLYRIIPRTILYFMTGRKLQLHGGGCSVRSFIHIEDVAKGTLLATLRGRAGEIFHFSTSRNISIRELVEMIASRMGVSFEDSVEVVGDRLGKDSAYLLDSSKAKNELGWSAEIGLEDGINQTIRWVSDNLDVLRAQPEDYIHKP